MSQVALPLLRAFQLVSQSLPVGAYAYSQGLETAIDSGWITNQGTLSDWVDLQMRHVMARTDLPILARLYRSIESGDQTGQLQWSRRLVAMRETRELAEDDCGRGRAFAVLLRDLGLPDAEPWLGRRDSPFAALAALAAVRWSIRLPDAMAAYLWGWLENQILVGVKLIPLGQVAGQRMLLESSEKIPNVCESAMAVDDDDLGAMLPLVAIASSLHEIQYSRLFRS